MGERVELEVTADPEASGSATEDGNPHYTGGVPIDASGNFARRCAAAPCKVCRHASVCLSLNRGASQTDKLKQEERNLEFKLERNKATRRKREKTPRGRQTKFRATSCSIRVPTA